MWLGFKSSSLDKNIKFVFEWSSRIAEGLLRTSEKEFTYEICWKIFLDKKSINLISQKKAISFEHPLISFGMIYSCEGEYAEDRDGKKREYAPKIMVATST